MPKQTSRRGNARGQVIALVDTLGMRIVSGAYQQGETLPIEQELADSLDVGRNALREAVKVLSGKGLLSTAPRSGTRVRSRDEWNMLDPDVLRWHANPDFATRQFMLDLIELRRIIEPRAAELAATRATKEDIANILAAFEDMAAHDARSEKRLEGDIRFHASILKASHNSVLNHFKHAISTYLKAHFKTGQALDAAADSDDLERHRKIAWAIAAGKKKSAYSLTVEMLDLNRSHFEGD